MAEELAEELLARALETLEVSVCIADARLADLPLVWVNAAFTATTGYAAEDVLGRNCRFLQGSRRDQPGVAAVRQALVTGTPVEVTLVNERADGTAFSNRLAITPPARRRR